MVAQNHCPFFLQGKRKRGRYFVPGLDEVIGSHHGRKMTAVVPLGWMYVRAPFVSVAPFLPCAPNVLVVLQAYLLVILSRLCFTSHLRVDCM